MRPYPRTHRYRLYIDESGDHTYKRMDDPSHRYLALVGVWFRQHYEHTEFADNLAVFKRKIFGPRPDEPVILHRSDIINRRGPFGVLCDQSVHAEFDSGLLEVIRRGQFRLVRVVIDKQRHLDQYVAPFHPYHYCLAAMLDRYSGWLAYKNMVGDVMAESRGGSEDRQLKEAYRRVYESGTLMMRRDVHQRALTSKDLKMQPKRANIAGLQLADVLAYPVKQAFLVERGCLDDPGEVFGKAIVEEVRVGGKFNRNERTGKVAGYGLVWLPTK